MTSQSHSTHQKAVALTKKWGNLLETNPAELLEYYHPQGILVPTLSDRIYYGTSEIGEYFVEFLKTLGAHRKVIFTSVSGQWDSGGKWIMTTGKYVFLYIADGEQQEVHARFTYLFTFSSELGWKIANHHSSLEPK